MKNSKNNKQPQQDDNYKESRKKPKKGNKFLKFLKFLFVSILLVIIIVAITIGVITLRIVNKNSRELPDVALALEGYKTNVPSIIYDRNGKEIDILYSEIREEIPLGTIPVHTKHAFMAMEDKRFENHYGLDPVRIFKAAIVNIQSGKTVQGGSTITQQLAKNAFLNNEKSLDRKVKEAIFSIQLEQTYSKDEILRFYLNEAYFGSGIYGLQTASKSFLGKDVKDLNIAESALMAAVVNNGNYYNVRNHLSRTVERGSLALKQMLSFGFITQEEYDEASKYKFVNESEPTVDDSGNIKYAEINPDPYTITIMRARSKKKAVVPDFTDFVKSKVFELFPEEEVLRGGLKIYTTLDLDMQKIAVDTFNDFSLFKQRKGLQGAMITTDIHTGEVLSIVGGYDFKAGNFNRAIRAKKQPGSSFKPFIYFSALKSGMPMTQRIVDEPISYGNWRPKNYGGRFRGPTTMMMALEKSINIVAIKLLNKVGVDEVIENIRTAGIDESVHLPENLTLALGTPSLSPLELSEGYLPLINGGYRIEPTFITKIVNRYDEVVYQSVPNKKQVFDSANSAMIVRMLEGVVRHGTGKRAKIVNLAGKAVPQGGKTGTTNENKAAWYVGFTPDTITSAYVAYDNNKPMHGVTGSSVAPLWGSYYQKLISEGVYKPSLSFRQINDTLKSKKLQEVEVDINSGRSIQSLKTARNQALQDSLENDENIEPIDSTTTETTWGDKRHALLRPGSKVDKSTSLNKNIENHIFKKVGEDTKIKENKKKVKKEISGFSEFFE